MPLPKHNIRHALNSFVPNWLSNRQNLNIGYKILFAVALICDFIVEVMIEGLFAAWPGKGTPSALSLIGRGRGFLRGVGESDDAYAARLRGWLDVWPNAGSDELLVTLIQNYLGGSLVVRIVDRRGNFTSIAADGTITKVKDSSWNFDATELPTHSAWYSDLWIIVYLDTRWPTYSNFSDSAWVNTWGSTSTYGVGHQVPRSIVSDITTILATFKGAHTWIESIIFTTDASLFIPGSLGSTYPNGRWGNWSIDSGGSQTPSRALTSPGGELRYWNPRKGG